MAETQYRDTLLQLLVDQEMLTDDQAVTVWEEHESSGRSSRSLLVDMGMIEEPPLLEIIAGYLGTRVINLPATDIPPSVIHAVPASVARMYSVVPVSMEGNSIPWSGATVR